MEFIFTFDLEDSRPSNKYPKRYPEVTRQVLDFLQQHEIKGTFFIVGEVIEDCPELIKRVAQQGHEIAFHSHNHTPLTLDTPANFREKTLEYKKKLEDLTSQEVVGYRAPIFSMTAKTLWAADILPEIGFQYSSSILPDKNPLFGFKGAPSHPFLHKSGLVEFPVPLLNLKFARLPALGGIYLRYLPLFLTKRLLTKSTAKDVLWSYCHPYDFDHKEKFFVFKNNGFITSILLWCNRTATYRKFKSLFRYHAPHRMKDLLQSKIFMENLIQFNGVEA